MDFNIYKLDGHPSPCLFSFIHKKSVPPFLGLFFAFFSASVNLKRYIFFLWLFMGISQGLLAQQVTLDKGVDLTSALSGETLKYTLDFGCSSLTTDCVGAKLIDTLPPQLTFLSATNAIVESQSGPMVIVPVYNATNHTVIWDFTILSENGLPDGASGTVEILVRINPGVVQNNVAITNTATIPSANAGNAANDATTTITGVSPKWTVTKQVISGAIYHDRPVQYQINVCSDGTFGNLNLTQATVTDMLPQGAVFISATNSGTHTGGNPGMVTWLLADTLKVTEPCRNMTISVLYPATDLANNNTGLTTSIPKFNEATLTATALGGASVTKVGSINQPLLPPFFDLNVKKTPSGEGMMQDSAQGRFTITPSNNSTVPVNNFVITDFFPDQFDLTQVKLRAFDTLIPLNILVELNHSGSFINWQTNVNPIIDQTFSVGSIAGWTAGTSFVSGIKFDFGTVPAGFGVQKGSFGLFFTPSTPIDNVGGTTPFTTPIKNVVSLSAIRPIDNVALLEQDSATMCIVPTNLGILMPTASVQPNYVTPVAGDPTQGNPYFKGARVRYDVVVENDGVDSDVDNIDPVSNITIINPIGSNLLPAQMTYEVGSWQIAENTTGLVLDNSGTNPIFETVLNFNGTGKTLLRWHFTGNFKPSEHVRISFNATIKDTVPAGTVVTNNFAMSTESEFSCGGLDCSQQTTGLNDYFGTVADPSIVLPNIDQLCLTAATFTVADTTTIPIPSKSIISAGPYAPSGSDPVELGLSTDTVSYTIGLCNQNVSNLELKNPILLDLLPLELSFVPGSVALASNTTGLAFDGVNPAFDIVNDFAGTGRTLLRWKFTADLPVNKCVNYSFKSTIKPGSGGTVSNEPFSTSNDRKFQCAFGEVIDNNDMDDDGNISEAICRAANSADFVIPIIKSMQAKKYVKGAKNLAYLGSDRNSLGIGGTFPSDSVLWRLKVSNPGNVTLTDAIVVDVFPHLNDKGVQLNTSPRLTEWVPYLAEPIVSPKPTIKIWYSQNTNPCRAEISPVSSADCVDDWSETPPSILSTVKSVKFTFLDEDIDPAEAFWFDIKMLAPDSILLGRPGIAWNSLARDAAELPAQEPNKVGILIQGYDLALHKNLAAGQPTMVTNGEDVNFTITLINHSSDTVKNIEITDYIPAGMTLNDPDWTDLGSGKASLNLPLLAQNDSLSVNITLKVDATNIVGTTLDNYAEISDFEDELGNHPHDWDSFSDSDPANDDGGGIGTAADNVTWGNGQGAAGDGMAATDEDDHDGARVTICPRFTQNSAPDQYICSDDLTELNDIVVPTTAATTESLKFVYFSSQQAPSNIYTGGTDLLTVNPSGGTVTLPEVSIPTALGNYWIYAILASQPTDPNCRPYDEIFVQINPPVVATSSNDTSICPGFSANISAYATGGTGTYTYTWDNGLPSGSSQTVTPSVSTTYNVTVTDSGGNCVATESVTVTLFPQPIVEAGVDQAACQGQSVTFTTSANGGTPTYNYTWSNGANTPAQTFNALATTTYTVTVTDANGCADTDDLLLTVFDISASTPSPIICLNQSANISATLNSGTASSYLWSTGETSNSITVTPISAGTHAYTVTVTDINNCTDIATVTIMVNPLPIADAGQDIEICATSSTTLTATGGSSYLWSNGATTASTTVTPATTTTYTVTVTDANGCTDTDEIKVTVNPLPTATITAVETSGAANDDKILSGANVSLTATGSATYAWSDGLGTSSNATATPSLSTTYTVTITDVNGCTDTETKTITVKTAPSVSIGFTETSCTANDGSIMSGDNADLTASATGGTPNYTFTWDNTLGSGSNKTVSPLATTNYNVTVTDSDGFTATASSIITLVARPTLTVETVSCQASLTQYDVAISATGGAVSTSAGTISGGAVINIPIASSVTITVADGATGCSVSQTVTPPNCSCPSIAAPTSTNQAICQGAAMPTLTATATGFVIDWYAAATSGTLLVTASNTYTPTGVGTYYAESRDTVSNCKSATRTAVMVTENSLPTASITATETSGTANDDKILSGESVTLTATGGSTYAWNTNETSASITTTPSVTTTYTVTITDTNGCTDTETKTITVKTAPSVSIAFSETSCTANDGSIMSGDNAALTASATGGTPNYTFSWDNALGSGDIKTVNPTTTTTYNVTVTDSDGFTATASSTITLIARPTLTIGTVSCQANLTQYDVAISATGGAVSTSAGTISGGAVINIPIASSVTITVADGATGCNVSQTVTPPNCKAATCTDDIVKVDTIMQYGKCHEDSLTVCLPVRFDESYNYNIYNGLTLYNAQREGCDFDTLFQYNYFVLPGQGANGPYRLDYWNANGKTFTAASITSMRQLVDSMNLWDPAGAWTLDVSNLSIVGGLKTNDYRDMRFTTLRTGAISIIRLNLNIVSRGTRLKFKVAGTPQTVVFENISTGCKDTVMLNILPNESNNPPLALFDEVSTLEDTPISIAVLLNDTDMDSEIDTMSLQIIQQPTHGTALINADGTIKYTPSVNYFGIDSLIYKICDNCSPAACDTAIVYFNVNPVNDPIVANVDGANTNQNTPVTISIKNNDNDLDGDLAAASITITELPRNGSVTVNPDGTLLYTPNTGFYGIDTLIYRLCDVGTPQLCDTAIVFITVNKVNQVPVANREDVSTLKNIPTGIGILTNDTKGDGLKTGSLTITKAPKNGSFTINPNNPADPNDDIILYTPNTGFVGVDTLNYQICDVDGDCDTAMVTITIQDIDENPVANTEGVSTDEDTPIKINVLLNDNFGGNGASTHKMTIISAPKNGVIVVNDKGTASTTDDCLDYTPNLNYNGRDSLIYQICDADGDCDTAIVFITINPINDAPVANWDKDKTKENTPKTVVVLTNDSDTEGGLLPSSVTVTEQPKHGTATVNADGTIVYTPNRDYAGNDTLIYSVCDKDSPLPAQCDTAIVFIEIEPTCVDDIIKTDVLTYTGKCGEDSLTVCLPIMYEQSFNYKIFDNGILYNVQLHSGAGGCDFDTLFQYNYFVLPGRGATGPYRLDYWNIGTKTYNIASLNSMQQLVDSMNVWDAAGQWVLNTNDLSIVGGVKTTPYADMRFTTLRTGAVSLIRLNLNIVGRGTRLRFKTGTHNLVLENINTGCKDRVTINARPDPNNKPPVATFDLVSVSENDKIEIPVLANDFDLDSDIDSSSLRISQQPKKGVATVKNGIIEYIPTLDFFGRDSFIYTLCDKCSPATCDTAIVFINVIETHTNKPPVALDDVVSTDNNTPISETVATNDSDSDTPKENLTYILLGNVPNTEGVLTLNPDGIYTFLPNPNFIGTVKISYKVCDTTHLCDTASLTIHVKKSVNNAPFGNDATVETVEEDPVSGEVTATDMDDEPTTLTHTLLSNPKPNEGEIEFNPDGTFTFQPAPNFSGTVVILTKVCDTRGLCDTVILTIVVVKKPCDDIIGDKIVLTNVCSNNKEGEICLNMPKDTLSNYKLFINGNAYTKGFTNCRLDTLLNYNYFVVPGKGISGPYSVEWVANGGTLKISSVRNMKELVDSLNKLDAPNRWQLHSPTYTITSDNIRNGYGLMTIKQIRAGGKGLLQLNKRTIVKQAAIKLEKGNHFVTFVKNNSECRDSAQIVVACVKPEMKEIEVNLGKIDTLCLDVQELTGKDIKVVNACAATNDNVIFNILPNSTCITMEGKKADQTDICFAVCDENGVCDTTYIYAKVKKAKIKATNDSVTVRFNTPIKINVMGNDSASGAGNSTITIVANPNHGTAVVGSDGSIDYMPHQDYCSSKPDSMRYVVCNTTGCDTAYVRVTILCEDVKFYTGFSPNGDGMNEVFFIEGLEKYPNNRLCIYNRWGNQILEVKGYKNDWDGQWNGKILPDGTYFYLFDKGDGDSTIYSGYVQIQR